LSYFETLFEANVSVWPNLTCSTGNHQKAGAKLRTSNGGTRHFESPRNTTCVFPFTLEYHSNSQGPTTPSRTLGLYHIILYDMILYCIILYYIILYYIILCYIISYHNIFYTSIIYYIILCNITLHHVMSFYCIV